MAQYFEKQYEILDKTIESKGLANFGPMSSFTWNTDPKRLLFVLSRYKFAARMLEGSNNAIEIGCGDGFASRIIKQHVANLLITDADPVMIQSAASLQSPDFPVSALCHDFCKSPLKDRDAEFDAAYMLDVLEHIPQAQEAGFFANLRKSLAPGAKIVIGIPSIESQPYASPGSKAGHVNCKTKEQLYKSLANVFSTVFCFSMNDEVVHTGFNRMSNYLFAVCSI
jgi:2-polyprenyl-3-methyl-5-hydroxy-6-metoxy-1,4-benzoquinol methylase